MINHFVRRFEDRPLTHRLVAMVAWRPDLSVRSRNMEQPQPRPSLVSVRRYVEVIEYEIRSRGG